MCRNWFRRRGIPASIVKALQARERLNNPHARRQNFLRIGKGNTGAKKNQ
jgi:hypothetical protein